MSEIETFLAKTPLERNDIAFRLRVLRADLDGFSLYHHRSRVDAFLATAKNSGTHWVRHMLSHAIADQYGIAPPAFTSGWEAERIISHPKLSVRLPGIPLVGTFHNIPSAVFSWRWLTNRAEHPPVIVLVRDIRDAMRSNYIKWERAYNVPLSAYTRGDPWGKRYIADLWWYIHYFNRWGAAAEAQPQRIKVLRYPDVQKDPESALKTISEHLRLKLSAQAIDAGLRYASRKAIAQELEPTNPEIVVSSAQKREKTLFSAEDERFIHNVLIRNLKYDFGFGLIGARRDRI